LIRHSIKSRKKANATEETALAQTRWTYFDKGPACSRNFSELASLIG